MSYREIVTYIQNKTGQGISKDQVVANLKSVGWADADIEKAFRLCASAGSAETADAGLDMHRSLGTVAIALAVGSWMFSFFLPLPIAGIIVSILALKNPKDHTKAIWGLVLSSVSLLMGILLVTVFFWTFANSSDFKDYPPQINYSEYGDH